eukprot:598403-Prymnesium_polylepis.1
MARSVRATDSEDDEGFVGFDSPLFEEYLRLLGEVVVSTDPGDVAAEDALLVIDMQADFFELSPNNRHGGRFGVPEADMILDPIVLMMEYFASCGAT